MGDRSHTWCRATHGETPGTAPIWRLRFDTSAPTTKPRVAVTFDAEVFDQLKVIAKAENRSVANLIEMWVLAELTKQWTETPAAVATESPSARA